MRSPLRPIIGVLLVAGLLPPSLAHARQEAAAETSAPDAPPAGPVGFYGVIPGQTSAGELRNMWGEPLASDGASGEATFAREPFQSLVVTLAEDRVTRIVVHLAEPLPRADVLRELDLPRAQSVRRIAPDGEKQLLFPEWGVSLCEGRPDEVQDPSSAGKSSPTIRIQRIEFTGLDATHFLLRAEQQATRDCRSALHDATVALELSPEDQAPRLLRARLFLEHGQRLPASAAVEALLKQAAADPQVRLLAASWDLDAGRPQEAWDRLLSLTRTEPAANQDPSPLIYASALLLQADAQAALATADPLASIRLRQAAIRALIPRTATPDSTTGGAVYRRLVEAHLGIARDLAWGNLRNRSDAVSLWLDRAAQWSERAIAARLADADLRRVVAREALAAAAGAPTAIDPGPRVQAMLQLSRRQIEASPDPLRRSQLEWELGTALFDALLAYVGRHEEATALEYGELAVEYLESALPQRQCTPREEYLVGRLYFRLGTLVSGGQTPSNKLRWLRRAEPYLSRALAQPTVVDTWTHAETCLALGHGLWTLGQPARGVDWTKRGVAMLEQLAAEDGGDARQLQVARQNLAAMLAAQIATPSPTDNRPTTAEPPPLGARRPTRLR